MQDTPRTPAKDPNRPMRLLEPLRSPPMALLWAGMSLSALGDQLYAVALTWIAVGLLGSAAGYLSALSAAVLLGTLLGVGRWADGWDQRRSMVAADAARAAVLLATVAAWAATGAPSTAMLVLAVTVLALSQAVFQPALQSVLPGLVPDPRLLPAANGLLDSTERSARLLGPGLVAVLAGLLPVMHFLTLDALSFCASAAALTQIGRLRPAPPPPAPPPAARAPRPREPISRAIRRGAAALRGHPLLGFMFGAAGWVNGAWYAAFFLALPLLIEQHGIRGGLAAYGLIISAYGCTNLLATLAIAGRPLPSRLPGLIFGGKLITGAGTVLLGLAAFLPPAWLLPGLAAAAAAAAVGGPMGDIPVAVLRQTRLARQAIPAATRAYLASSTSGALLAMLLAPTALRAAGPVVVIVGCGAVMVGVGLLGLARHGRWQDSAVEA